MRSITETTKRIKKTRRWGAARSVGPRHGGAGTDPGTTTSSAAVPPTRVPGLGSAWAADDAGCTTHRACRSATASDGWWSGAPPARGPASGYPRGRELEVGPRLGRRRRIRMEVQCQTVSFS